MLTEANLPDLDRDVPAVLDLATGRLAQAPRPALFATEAEFMAALALLGDLAYEDADGGLLFVASGRAVALGKEIPAADGLASLGRRLQARSFLRGRELDPGSFFAVLTRGDKLVLGKIVVRTSGAIQLVLAPGIERSAAFPVEWVEVLANARGPGVASALLPPLARASDSVLRLSDARLAPGPALKEPFSAQQLTEVVAGVRLVGDLAYLQMRSGMLVVASGKSAALGNGPARMLAGRDLRGRLRERALLAESEIAPGNVLLIETTTGKLALLRIDGLGANGLGITWLLQTDGTGVFHDLAAFDASFEVPEQRELDRRLLVAAARGDVSQMQRLIEMGADANATSGEDGRPALLHAIITGDVGAVALLLAAGADPASANAEGWNALHAAVKFGRVDLVEALLAAGADPELLTGKGEDALQIALDARRPNPKLIRALRAVSERPDTLSLAARVGDVAALDRMLEAGVDVNAAGAGEPTALLAAAAAGQTEAIRALLEAGADPSLESEHDGSALLAAARGGHTQSVELLLEHGGSSAEQKAGALYAVTEKRDPELARLFLSEGADASLDAGAGVSPLDHALRYGDDAVVDVYVEAGHSLTVAAAARLGRVEGLTEMLEAGADPRALGSDGRAPLQYAIENDRTESLRVLLDHGVDADAAFSTWDRRSPLHVAAERRDGDLAALLLERGANPDARDRVGRTPLYDAVILGREKTARVLLEAGADPNLAPKGEALLDVARKDSLRELLQSYGARPGKRAAAAPPSN